MMASGAQSSLQADLIAFDDPDASRHADAASRPADGIPDDACAHAHADRGDANIAGADAHTAANAMPAASPLIEEIGSVCSSRAASASNVSDSVPHVAGPGDNASAHAVDAGPASVADADAAVSADGGKALAGSPANADAVLASLEADDWDADDGCGFATDPQDTMVGIQHEKGNRDIESGQSTAPDAGAAASAVLAPCADCGGDPADAALVQAAPRLSPIKPKVASGEVTSHCAGVEGSSVETSTAGSTPSSATRAGKGKKGKKKGKKGR